MAQKPLLLSQPEIEDVERYRHVIDQKHRFCDKSSVGFFEVYGKHKGNFEELDTEGLLAKLRSGACGESRRGKEDGGELRIRVLYVENSLFPLVLGLPVFKLVANHDEITTFPLFTFLPASDPLSVFSFSLHLVLTQPHQFTVS